MTDSLFKTIDADMSAIPVSAVEGDTDKERVMKTAAQMLLRLWTRLALESGQKLKMTPSQYSLGTYDGQMKWHLNANFDFKGLSQIELGLKFKRRHCLIGEAYQVKKDDRFRLAFALEEEEVKGKPVMVNYLVYDESMKAFSISAAVEALKPVVPSWLETIGTANEKPLWSYCKDNLECVGI